MFAANVGAQLLDKGCLRMEGDVMVSNRRLVSSMAAAFAFALGCSSSVGASEQATPAPVASPTVIANSDDAAVVWDWIKNSSDQSQLERFIKRYQGSAYAVNARIRLEMLKHPKSAPASVVRSPKPAASTAVVRTDSSRYSQLECRGFWCGWQFPVLLGVGF
jgi:hypothetical protein